MKLIKYFFVLSIIACTMGVTSVNAKSLVGRASLSVNPEKYSASAGGTTLEVTLDVASQNNQKFKAEIAVGGVWWGGGFTYSLAPGVRITDMYCNWWGCTHWVEGVASANKEIIMYPSTNAVPGYHNIGTATVNVGDQELGLSTFATAY